MGGFLARACPAGVVLFAFLAAVPAQTVRVANHAEAPFAGWLRTTVDTKPPGQSGVAVGVDQHGDTQKVRWVLAHELGVETWCLDVHATVAPGQQVVVDIGASRESPVEIPKPLTDVGPLRANGTKIEALTITQDGAAWTVHGRTRIGRMTVVDVWLRSYGESWAHGEAMVTASKPLVEDMAETLPLGVSLTLDGAVVVPVGGPPGLIVPPGTTIGDGQARPSFFVVVWPNDDGELTEPPRVGAVGIEHLHPTGNARHDGAAVARVLDLYPEAARRLHTWQEGVLGIPAWSGRTGAQEDQMFHGEAVLSGGVGCELVVAMCAAKWANRWCHHLESDGSQLSPQAHPRLLMWDGRPHSAGGDMLGKRGTPNASGDWRGPDVEHWLIQRLYEGARLTGRPSLQWLLSAQARLYLTQWTTTPGLYTSQAYAARARGYEGLNAAALFLGLRDRALAERVRSHFRARWERVLAPACAGDLWDTRRDDPRLGAGEWWMPWQQALGAWGLDVAGEVFAMPAVREAALRAARRVLNDAWILDEGAWLTAPVRPVAIAAGFTDEQIDVTTARAFVHRNTGVPRAESLTDAEPPLFDASFNYYGMSLAVAVVLRHDAADERSGSIWRQLEAGARTAAQFSWLAPGVKVSDAVPAVPVPSGGGR